MRHPTHRQCPIRRAVSALALGLALSLTVASCGSENGSDTTSEVSNTEHNEADVAFATDMIQHHAQALAMVDLTVDRPLDSQVQRLADHIRAAQGPEIETMTDWLTGWNEKVPETMRDHANAGHDLDDTDHPDMPGMMTAEDMKELEDASDAEFQTMWLEMMVEHHTGAVEMAKTEQEDGQYKPAVDLAVNVADAQTAEIEKMQSLLGS